VSKVNLNVKLSSCQPKIKVKYGGPGGFFNKFLSAGFCPKDDKPLKTLSFSVSNGSIHIFIVQCSGTLADPHQPKPPRQHSLSRHFALKLLILPASLAVKAIQNKTFFLAFITDPSHDWRRHLVQNYASVPQSFCDKR
jgi:hypothetical protein